MRIVICGVMCRYNVGDCIGWKHATKVADLNQFEEEARETKKDYISDGEFCFSSKLLLTDLFLTNLLPVNYIYMNKILCKKYVKLGLKSIVVFSERLKFFG